MILKGNLPTLFKGQKIQKVEVIVGTLLTVGFELRSFKPISVDDYRKNQDILHKCNLKLALI